MMKHAVDSTFRLFLATMTCPGRELGLRPNQAGVQMTMADLGFRIGSAR